MTSVWRVGAARLGQHGCSSPSHRRLPRRRFGERWLQAETEDAVRPAAGTAP
jgi:hypothetical protein